MDRELDGTGGRDSLNKALVSRLAGTLLAFVCFAAGADTWVMPTPYSDSTFHTVNIRQFADEVNRLTEGKLVIEIHSGGSLIKHAEIADAVVSGRAQIGEVFQSTLADRNPLFSADGIPFLATSYADAERLYNAEFEQLKVILAGEGLIPLFSVPWPPQGLYSKVELTDPAEFAGKAFRVYNSTLEQLASSLGSIPTRLEVSEIPAAFQRGEIDAMMTSATTGATTKSWEYLNFFYDLQAWLPKNIVLVNSDAYNALPPDQREAVNTAASNARSNGWLLSQIDAVEAVKTLFENGMTVLTPGQDLADTDSGGAMREVSPAVLDQLKAVGDAIKSKWLDSAGAEGEKLLKTYEEVSQ